MNPTYGAKCNKCRKEKTYYSNTACAECAKTQDFLKEVTKREAVGTGSNEEPSTSTMVSVFDTLEDAGSIPVSDNKYQNVDLSNYIFDDVQVSSNEGNPSTDSTMDMEDYTFDEEAASNKPPAEDNVDSIEFEELNFDSFEANKENIPPIPSSRYNIAANLFAESDDDSSDVEETYV